MAAHSCHNRHHRFPLSLPVLAVVLVAAMLLATGTADTEARVLFTIPQQQQHFDASNAIGTFGNGGIVRPLWRSSMAAAYPMVMVLADDDGVEDNVNAGDEDGGIVAAAGMPMIMAQQQQSSQRQPAMQMLASMPQKRRLVLRVPFAQNPDGHQLSRIYKSLLSNNRAKKQPWHHFGHLVNGAAEGEVEEEGTAAAARR